MSKFIRINTTEGNNVILNISHIIKITGSTNYSSIYMDSSPTTSCVYTPLSLDELDELIKE